MADDSSRQGTRYADGALLEYVDRVHAAHDTALARAFGSPAEHDIPSIQIGPNEGRVLELLLRLIGATKVVEIGTLAGYSAIRIARALPPGGQLWTIENDPRHAAIARINLAAAGLAGAAEVLEGSAREILPQLASRAPFDAVFIDADKESYDYYGEWATDHLRPGGLLLADNVYFFGNLLEKTEAAETMRKFHEQAAEQLDTACIPTPDGMLLGVKR